MSPRSPWRARDAPGLGPHLHDRAVRVVVDEQRRLGEAADGVAEPRPVRLGELAGPELARVDARLRREQALGELEVAHLHREEQDRALHRDGDVGGRAQGERRVVHEHVGGDEVVDVWDGEVVHLLVTDVDDRDDLVPPDVRLREELEVAGVEHLGKPCERSPLR